MRIPGRIRAFIFCGIPRGPWGPGASVCVGWVGYGAPCPIAVSPAIIRTPWRVTIFLDSERYREPPAGPYMSDGRILHPQVQAMYPPKLYGSMRIVGRLMIFLDSANARGSRCRHKCRAVGYGGAKFNRGIPRKFPEPRRC